MKFSCILILPFLIIYASADDQPAAVPGTVEQSCNNLATTCDESSKGCGMAGSSNNWLYDKDNAKCIVVDCNQLTNSGAIVSSFACASCFTSGTSSAGMNAGNIYANTNGDACVSIDCVNLALQQQMTTANCIICVGKGSTVNSDNSTCTNSTSSSLIVIASSLLFLSLLI
ncbi:cell surface immobilization antigen (macronuclear) [Tetrahymena thermophila SB210]|uniref:Cell surface immobilization antigen n=1 Tax=Tetrahymena thermophila (strain SB210) TaxID=312017 RepID=I7MMS4_TETTS|nr:cell surface immobilization antigen [Tetrahymena thermophila SB210]EAS06309.1 cell surface immobilization antigen [Tetrahymena thermophila SB210]|eukprot:XP_001026554.1 cell surface immobilization antigen [Tetrahymena thermophila SB210]